MLGTLWAFGLACIAEMVSGRRSNHLCSLAQLARIEELDALQALAGLDAGKLFIARKELAIVVCGRERSSSEDNQLFAVDRHGNSKAMKTRVTREIELLAGSDSVAVGRSTILGAKRGVLGGHTHRAAEAVVILYPADRSAVTAKRSECNTIPFSQ